MLVYRISPEKYAHDLSGEGSRLFGGRWNRKGESVLYTADSPSLAMLEILAFYAVIGRPPELMMVTMELPDSVTIEKPEIKDLPTDWNALPQKPSTLHFGSAWINAVKASVLRVPSVITPNGFGWNYILNVTHPELVGMISIKDTVKWEIDSRLAAKWL